MDPISIFVINYNGENILLETIQSLKDQDYPVKSITLIDDGSTDNSIRLVKEKFPQIKIIDMGYNTKSLNKLRRLAVDTAQSKYVFITDNDIILEKNCLSALADIMEGDPKIGICTPRLMYYSDKEKINISWTKLHYLCNSISPKRDTYSHPGIIPEETVGGGVMLIDKEKIKKIGSIDDSLPMGWGDDAEIYIRMKIAGFKTLHIPSAAGYHYAKEWTKKRTYRAFGQVYNRWFIILSMYQIKTIILLLPAFIVYELFLFFMLILKGLAWIYITATVNLIKNINFVLKRRKFIQSTRSVKDKAFLTAGQLYVPPAHLSNPVYKIGISFLNKAFNLYWDSIENIL